MPKSSYLPRMNPSANNRQYYGIKPLAQTSITNPSISIRIYESGKGWDRTATSSIFNADIEGLALSFLEAIDTITLQPFPFDEEKQQDAANDDIVKLIAAKNKLATEIAKSVEPLFQYLPNAAHLNAATTAMLELLQQSLYKGYSADSITVSNITGEARIYKDGQPLNSKEQSEDEAVDTATFPIMTRNCVGATAPFDQIIIPQNAAATSPQELRQFDYNTTIFFSENETGIIFLGIDFKAPQQSSSVVTNNALLTALVEFTTNWNMLQPDMPTADPSANGWTAIQRKALKIVAEMCETIANAWTPIVTDTAASFDNTWQLSVVNNETKGLLLRLPVNADIAYKGWPDLFIDNELLAKTILNENECLYAGQPSSGTPVQIQFGLFDIFATTQVSTGIGIQRNRFDESPLAVNPAFILTEPMVWNTPLQPSIEYNNIIALANGDAVVSFFNELLKDVSSTEVEMKLSYQYTIAESLPITIPVTYVPSAFYTAEFITATLAAVKEWLQTKQPEKGVFVMSIVVSVEKREIMKIDEVQFEIER